MNDASTSSDQPNENISSDHAAAAAPADNGTEPTQAKKRVQREQKGAVLDHLIRNIDIMVYCQLSTLYYME